MKKMSSTNPLPKKSTKAKTSKKKKTNRQAKTIHLGTHGK